MEIGTKLGIGIVVLTAVGVGGFLYMKSKQDESPLNKLESESGSGKQPKPQGTIQKDNYRPDVIKDKDTLKITLNGTTYLLSDSTIWTTDGYGYVPTAQEREDLKAWFVAKYPLLAANKKPTVKTKNELLGNTVYLSFDTIGTRFYDTFSQKW
jgi:hypothetical protein